MSDQGNGGASRVTSYELLKQMNEMEARLLAQINQLDRDQERRQVAARSDIRALDQTLNSKGGVVDRLDEIDGPEGALAKLRGRFVYALTIIGSAVGAVAYLAMKGGVR